MGTLFRMDVGLTGRKLQSSNYNSFSIQDALFAMLYVMYFKVNLLLM